MLKRVRSYRTRPLSRPVLLVRFQYSPATTPTSSSTSTVSSHRLLRVASRYIRCCRVAWWILGIQHLDLPESELSACSLRLDSPVSQIITPKRLSLTRLHIPKGP